MATTKSYINIANKYDRVVVLVDMDCFYCQVEEKLDPSLKGKPIAVVQYNAWRGGGIIAVNYPAREQGVTRHMRGDEAKEQCPDIVLAKVPNVREKADLTKYREAGKDVATVLQKFTPLLERASIDEAYLDITEEVVKRLDTMNQGQFQLKPTQLENTYAIGYENVGDYIQEISGRIECDTDDFDCEDEENVSAIRKSDLKLLLGAAITNEVRAEVKRVTGYDCSAGIAHNKILAKLACGINKPNKQTILPLRQISPMFSTLPVGKIKGLGGKFGEDLCEMLGIKFLGDLIKFSEAELQKRFEEKNGSWLYLIARGIDLECVMPRFYSKSIGCCKKFPGRNAITGIPTLEHWFGELANEISERMEKDILENNRKAKQMVISYIQEIHGQDVSSSRSAPLPSYDPDAIAKYAFDLLRKNTDVFLKPGNEKMLNNPLKFLGISVGKFESLETTKNTIQKLFQNHAKKKETDPVSLIESSKVKEDVSVLEPKPQQKSFFANYLTKNTGAANTNQASADAEVISDKRSDNETKASAPKEIKSFFLNAMKRRSDEQPPQLEAIEKQAKVMVEHNETVAINSEVSTNSEVAETSTVSKQNKTLLESTSTVSGEPSTSTSYVQTYAEFLVPEPKEADFTDCEKCGKRILTYDMQSHYDFHFAFELSQQQREQYRSEIKSKVVTTPPNKRPKISSNQGGNKKSVAPSQSSSNEISITKFLAKDTPNPTNIASPNEALQRCSECQALIAVDKVVEHMDYHAASKLQKEWNKQLMTNEIGQKLLDGATIAVAGRNNAVKGGGQSKGRTVKTKSIKAFFATQT